MSIILYLRKAEDSEIDKIAVEPHLTSDFFFDRTAQQNGDLVDFDKAWNAIDFTLKSMETSDSSALGILVAAGEKVGEAIGYEAPRIITSEAMNAFHHALSQLSDDDIRAQFNPAGMVASHVYLADLFQEQPQDGLQYVMAGISKLRMFAKKCSDTGSNALAAFA